MGGLRLQMPIVKGDGHLGKAAIYDWERESRHDQAAIKEYLDKEWHRKMQKKRDEDAGKALRQAAKTGDAETVGALIQAGVAVDHSDGDYGQTALHYAAREGRTGCIQVLLQHGANPNARNRDMRTPLHWAASNGSASAVRALAAGGADLLAKNADGDTALDIANFWNNPETAPALRHLLGFNRRIGNKCEGFKMGVQEHYSVQRVGVYPNTKCWR